MTGILEWFCFACAAFPAAMFARNLGLFRRLPPAPIKRPSISVLIPARNEERSIQAALLSVLASEGVHLECIVLDDHSSDATAQIVTRLSQAEPRLRLAAAPALPAGWCGKQHACSVLGSLASHDILCFLDADVRVTTDALARAAGFLETSGAPLVSGFPRQITGTWLEKLLIPLIQFVLLGFLPLARMRRLASPAYAAGCGQFMMARRKEYEASGGHAAFRSSLHDGIKLPAAFRKAGFRTDLFDATDIATCHMYTNAKEVWLGLAKNATEGMGSPARIVPFTAVLFIGQVLPFFLGFSPLLVTAAALAILPRLVAAVHFRQPLGFALLQPIAIAALLAIQWYALIRRLLGRPAGWKDRAYAT